MSNNELDSVDYIRPPDQSKKETLINNSGYNPSALEELDIENAIRESNNIAEQIEMNQYQLFMNKIEERKCEFNDILIKLHRLKSLDKTAREVFEIIISIITQYTNCELDNCKFDIETHNKIFTTLKTIRFTKCEMSSLNKIFSGTNNK